MRTINSYSLLKHQRGGVALMMLVAFIVLAVPMVVASNQVADQLLLSGTVSERKLSGNYGAASGVELALSELKDNAFLDALVPANPSVDLPPVQLNGQDVWVGIGVETFPDDGVGEGFGNYADIVLAVDNSGSVEPGQLDDLKMASNVLIDAFDLEGSATKMRMGLVRFRGSAETVVGMTDVDIHADSIGATRYYLNEKETFPTDFYYVNVSGALNNVFYFLHGRNEIDTGYYYPNDRATQSTVFYYLNEEGLVTYSYYYLNDDGASSLPSSIYYLNHAAADALHPWLNIPGSDQAEGSHTPALNVWEPIPEYWETEAFSSAGVIPADTWVHQQEIRSQHKNNDWRWKVELISGGSATPLFTTGSAGATTSWSNESNSHAASDIFVLAGDKLRVQLEVFSSESAEAKRLFEYRWGGSAGYLSQTEIPDLLTSVPEGEHPWDPAQGTGAEERSRW